MDSKPIKEAISFSEEKMQKNALFDSPRLFYDLYCLLPGQSQKVHAHEGSDKVYYVLEGTGRFTVATRRRTSPWVTPLSPPREILTASATPPARTSSSS